MKFKNAINNTISKLNKSIKAFKYKLAYRKRFKKLINFEIL